MTNYKIAGTLQELLYLPPGELKASHQNNTTSCPQKQRIKINPNSNPNPQLLKELTLGDAEK